MIQTDINSPTDADAFDFSAWRPLVTQITQLPRVACLKHLVFLATQSYTMRYACIYTCIYTHTAVIVMACYSEHTSQYLAGFKYTYRLWGGHVQGYQVIEQHTVQCLIIVSQGMIGKL